MKLTLSFIPCVARPFLQEFSAYYALFTLCLILILMPGFTNSSASENAVLPTAVTATPVVPVSETVVVNSQGDAADDPAIWINPTDVSASLILGTDKKWGVHVYDLQGNKVQSIPAGLTNNIDLRMIEDNQHWSAVAAASNRTAATVSLFTIDHDGKLFWLENSEIITDLTEPYGLCMFENEVGLQVFVNGKDGRFQQWQINPRDNSGDFTVGFDATLLREFSVPSQPEGCVADDANQRLFLGVEAEGIRTMAAHHQQPAQLQVVADIYGVVLRADVEGMTLYEQGNNGFLIVSSQGNNSYAVYDRLPPFLFRGRFTIQTNIAEQVDGVSDTDGIAVSSLIKTELYPDGILVVQDGENTLPQQTQNFKTVSWQDIAAALNL